MADRYVNDLALNLDPGYVESIIAQYISANEFKPDISKQGESYFKSKAFQALRGFKYNYLNGVLHIEAWIGKVGKELNLKDGKLYGALHKISYYNSILSLLTVLDNERLAKQPETQAPYNNQQNMQPQAPFYNQQNFQPQAPAYNQQNFQPQAPAYNQQNFQPQAPVYNQQNFQPQAPAYNQQNFQQQAPAYNQQNFQPQAPAYNQQNFQPQAPFYNQPVSAIQNEANKARDNSAVIAFLLALASFAVMLLSRVSIIVNIASYALAINQGLKSSKKGLAIAAIIINTLAMLITLVRIVLYIL